MLKGEINLTDNKKIRYVHDICQEKTASSFSFYLPLVTNGGETASSQTLK